MASQTPSVVRLADYRPPDYLVDEIDLHFDLDWERTLVRSTMRVRRAEGVSAEAPLVLDGRKLELIVVTLDGKALQPSAYAVNGETLTIRDVPTAFALTIETAVLSRENKSGHGLFAVGTKLATQCEAEGFRRITYFPDRPDVLARYAVTIEADKGQFPVLLSNGNIDGSGDMPGGRHWVRWVDPFPKPSYIFAVVAGDFGRLSDTFRTKSGKEVALNIHAEHDAVPLCAFAMASLKRALEWDERTYGLEYDLDIYNVVALAGYAGAMENKGLNVFEAHGIVADPEITTDDDFVLIERIIGHEQFHNWTGNRVTCRDWFQLCLKEGLTRFRDQSFMEDRYGGGAWRIDTVKALRRNQFPEDDGPAAHAVQPQSFATIENFYTTTIYDKGAEVVRMMAALLGWEAFRKGFDLYIKRHDGQAVTVEHFIRAMEDASGRDFGQLRLWYNQAGRPRVEARGVYDAKAKRYTLTLSQNSASTPGQPVKQPLQIPIRTGLVGRAGEVMSFTVDGARVTSTVLTLTKPTQTFDFHEVATEPVPSLLQGFSAPVSLCHDLSDEDASALIGSKTDAFVRWDTAQTWGTAVIRKLAAAWRAGRPLDVPASYVSAFARVIDDAAADPLLKAQILTIPDEPALSEGLAEIDLDALMAARDHLRATLARELGPRLERQISKTHAAFALDAASIARRKYENTCLELLSGTGTSEIAQLLLWRMKGADNMTDTFASLSALTHLAVPQRQAALDWFFERWKQRSTVIDKWFSVQALSRAPGAIDRILALEGHPAFDRENMARMMAYYGSFCRQNRVAFHDPSGRAYEFLADRLVAFDRMGRSGAHWLMLQINQWRRYDANRRNLMRRALARVAAAPGLSKGLSEVVARALGENS